jgi:putative redox protein
MAVDISVRYTGELHCNAQHGPSKTEIATDAPADNKGKGESFSPTDLVATALATCMATTVGIAAQDHGLDLSGMTVKIEKHMSKDAPRRIVGLPSEVHFPLSPDTPQRGLLEQVVLNCPVHKSLPPEIERPTKFFWEG